MNKLITLLFFSVILTQAVAQLPNSFAPIGTRWEYNHFSWYVDKGKYVYESIGDTLLNNTLYRVIKLTTKTKVDPDNGLGFTTRTSFKLYTVRNDSLFSLNGDNSLIFIFNFGCRKGDSLVIHYPSYPPSRKAVISRIADTIINNKRLKFWELTHTCVFGTEVRKPTQKLFELIGKIDWSFYDIIDRCPTYDASNRLCSFKTSDWTYEPAVCTYSVSTKDIQAMDFSVYPNPATDRININWQIGRNTEGCHLYLSNTQGQRILHTYIEAGKDDFVLDVPNIASGMYFLSLDMLGQGVFTQKVIVSK